MEMANSRIALDLHSLSPARNRALASAQRAALCWLLWAVLAGNLALIVVLWSRGGNVTGVHNLGELLSSIGRITGLLGAYFLLIQFILLARLPFLEPLLGFDRLTVWHRRNGKLALYLILAHVVFITVGYTLTDRISLGSEITALLTSYPGMGTATIGTALLVAVAISSFVIIRRRLRYETWYLVHLGGYVGLYLSWEHQLPTGNEFITNAPASRYWTGLYLATAAMIVLFRFVRPAIQSYWHRMRVAEVTVESPSVVSLRIAGRHLDQLGARPGQFFLWRFLTPGRWPESHPFSLSEAPDGESLRITVKHSGDFSSHIGEIKPGTAVVAEGPFGVFTQDVRKADRAVLIAGGIGITPVRALAEEMPEDSVLVYRVVNEDDLVFRDELDRLARREGLEVHYVVGDHSTPEGSKLLSPDHLRALVPDIDRRDVYLCGPPLMTEIIERNVRDAGVPRKQIHVERFAL